MLYLAAHCGLDRICDLMLQRGVKPNTEVPKTVGNQLVQEKRRSTRTGRVLSLGEPRDPSLGVGPVLGSHFEIDPSQLRRFHPLQSIDGKLFRESSRERFTKLVLEGESLSPNNKMRLPPPSAPPQKIHIHIQIYIYIYTYKTKSAGKAFFLLKGPRAQGRSCVKSRVRGAPGAPGCCVPQTGVMKSDGVWGLKSGNDQVTCQGVSLKPPEWGLSQVSFKGYLGVWLSKSGNGIGCFP